MCLNLMNTVGVEKPVCVIITTSATGSVRAAIGKEAVPITLAGNPNTKYTYLLNMSAFECRDDRIQSGGCDRHSPSPRIIFILCIIYERQ
jgi:hypothetical protein